MTSDLAENNSSEQVPAQSSWWDYLGLGPAVPASVEVAAITSSELAGETPSGAAVLTDSSHRESTEARVPQETETSAVSAAPQTTSDLTWYSPWRLYDWYTQPSSALDAPSQSDELANDDVVAQPELSPSVNTSGEGPVVSPANTELSNPITSSLVTNSKGWAAFFSSSRSLTTKMITERGEAGMEVMNIDDDESEGIGSAPPTPTPASTPLMTMPERDEKCVKGQSAPARTPSLRSVASSSSKTKETQMNTPLTSSDSTKRKVAAVNVKRAASPAPSKKSIAPLQPRPPNLILPTFKDTFHTLPRSKPPPTESTTSTLMKTWGYVNNLLLYGAHGAHIEAVKGKGKESHGSLEEFGKELPRAWDVLETAAPLPLTDCKNVVVIGIHGWFPGVWIVYCDTVSRRTCADICLQRFCDANGSR